MARFFIHRPIFAIVISLIIVIMGVLAGLAPAWRAMNIKPVDAMRDE